MTPRETYAASTARLLRELAALGWETRPKLKTPWAESPAGHRVSFHAQATYLGDSSLWLDRRGMHVSEFVSRVLAESELRARIQL